MDDFSSAQKIKEISSAYWQSQALFVALRFNLFEILGKKEKDAATLAHEVGVDPDALERLLDSLTALELIEKTENVYLIPSGMRPFLTGEKGRNMSASIAHMEHLTANWSRLEESIRTGKPVSYEEKIPDADLHLRTEKFMAAMEGYAAVVADELVRLFPLQGDERILDLGCGPGTYFRKYLKSYAEVQAEAADIDDVIPIIEGHLKAEDLEARVVLHPGDFRKITFPNNRFDVVLLSNVMHIYPEEEVRSIFRQVRKTLRPGGVFLVNDFFTDGNGTRPLWGALFSLNMLVNTVAGRNYSLQEGRALLDESGFVRLRSLPLPLDSTLLVGEKSS